MKTIHNIFIENISKRTSLDINIVSNIVDFAYSQAKEATSNSNSIEFSGLGVLHFKEKTAINGLRKANMRRATAEKYMNDLSFSPTKRATSKRRYDRQDQLIKELTERLDKFKKEREDVK